MNTLRSSLFCLYAISNIFFCFNCVYGFGSRHVAQSSVYMCAERRTDPRKVKGAFAVKAVAVEEAAVPAVLCDDHFDRGVADLRRGRQAATVFMSEKWIVARV